MFVIGIGNEEAMNMEMLNAVATEPVVDHIKNAKTIEGINKVRIHKYPCRLEIISFSINNFCLLINILIVHKNVYQKIY